MPAGQVAKAIKCEANTEMYIGTVIQNHTRHTRSDPDSHITWIFRFAPCRRKKLFLQRCPSPTRGPDMCDRSAPRRQARETQSLDLYTMSWCNRYCNVSIYGVTMCKWHADGNDPSSGVCKMYWISESMSNHRPKTYEHFRCMTATHVHVFLPAISPLLIKLLWIT